MLRILLVDDNADHRFLGRRALAALPEVSVTVAEDGAAAIARLAAERADLLLLDIKMPRMDGFDVLRALDRPPGTSPVVVMLSSSEDRTDRERALFLGADDYVTKPMDPKAFRESLQGLVARWSDEARRRAK